jgi:hypothetical protein
MNTENKSSKLLILIAIIVISIFIFVDNIYLKMKRPDSDLLNIIENIIENKTIFKKNNLENKKLNEMIIFIRTNDTIIEPLNSNSTNEKDKFSLIDYSENDSSDKKEDKDHNSEIIIVPPTKKIPYSFENSTIKDILIEESNFL